MAKALQMLGKLFSVLFVALIVGALVSSSVSANSLFEREIEINGRKGHLIYVNPTSSIVRVISPRSTAYVKSDQTPSIRDGLFLLDLVKRHRPLAILSGGYLSSFSPPRALGLLKVAGKRISGGHRSWLTTGMFCTSGDRYKILPATGLEVAELFPDCVQAGPYLVRDGVNRYKSLDMVGSGEREVALAQQSQVFLCITRNDNLILGFVDGGNSVGVASFAHADLGCVDALRLSGGITAGLWSVDVGFLGNNEVQLTDAIAIFARDVP